MIVTKIPSAPKPTSRKNAAAYTRVSDGKDAMLHSLSVQVSYYSGLIQRNPEWNYCGVYSDEDYTGTKAERPEFQRLLEDCRAGKIDIVLTKSISRLARNTVTLLETLRELTALGVSVFFEREGLWSNGGEGELILTILASFSQEESRSVSENCKWRVRKQFSEGKPTPYRVYGYRQEVTAKAAWEKSATGSFPTHAFIIIPEEAAIVQQIFSDYLAGSGLLAIQKKLLAQGVTFSKNGLAGMIRNEKYAGDLLLQKSFTQDHLSKKKCKNIGQLPQYLVQDNHPAIVDRAVFDAVQAEIARRAAKQHPAPHPKGMTAKAAWEKSATGRFLTHELTGKIRCGICGAPFGHKIAGSAPKYKKPVWICHTYNTLGKAHCPSQQIPDDILQAKIAEAGGMKDLEEIVIPGPFSLFFHYI